MSKEITSFIQQEKTQEIPVFSSEVAAGFPSIADDYLDTNLDLKAFLVPHPAATFFVRVSGDSMVEAGIFSKDLLIVDRSLPAESGNIIVALYQGEFTVKRFIKEKEGLLLVPANPAYSPIRIRDESEFQIWGVVTHAIHSFV